MIEQLAYGFARGFWRAYFDVIREQARVDVEKVTDEARTHASNFRDAVERLPPTTGPDHSEPLNPP